MGKIMGPEWEGALAPYELLLRMFSAGRISGQELETIFFPLYKHDPVIWPQEIFDVLDHFFADLDEYCSDAELRRQISGIDEAQLKARADSALKGVAGIRERWR